MSSEKVWWDEFEEYFLLCDCGNHNELDDTVCALCGEPLDTEFQCYVEKTFNDEHEGIIRKANEILNEYQKEGYTASLRQLYYQFVARGLLPNEDRQYKRLGGIITDARLAGRISFDLMEDRGRNSEGWLIQPDPLSVFKNIEYRYALDMWKNQDSYVEVWVEKDALSGVIERPCRQWSVPYMACKGYMSVDAMHTAGMRFKEASEAGKNLVLVHLGDHDPSGIDMTRDNLKRLEMFAEDVVDIRRVALNMDQIERYAPPPNPAKVTDSRAKEYIREFGATSWELDALSPSIIAELISSEVKSLVDFTAWDDDEDEQREVRRMLKALRDNGEDFLKQARDLIK